MFNTNTPSGLCSRFKWGIHSKVLLAWFPPPCFVCWLEYQAGKPGKLMFSCLLKNKKTQCTEQLKSSWRTTEILCSPSQGSAFTREGHTSRCRDLRYRSKGCSCFKQRTLSKRAAPRLLVHWMMPFKCTLSVLVQSTRQRAQYKEVYR